MISNRQLYPYFLFLLFFIQIQGNCFAQPVAIKNIKEGKRLVFGNEKMMMTLDYENNLNISSLVLNGEEVLDSAGVYSVIKTKDASYSTLHLLAEPVIKIAGNIIFIKHIVYGDATHRLNEAWKFTVGVRDIKLDINRTISNKIVAEQAALPVFIFRNINTWEGAYQGYGGLAWFYLFNKPLDTYGVHSNSSQFWNSKTSNGLSIIVNAPGQEVAMSYSRTTNDKLLYSIALSGNEMQPRFDSLTYRKRFINGRTDIWAPFSMPAGTSHQSITFSYFNFNDKYSRGTFAGINGSQVNSVLNTIARIGVIDKEHFGGNSWHTPFGPICLHEQYIAQLGVAINDKSYLTGYQQCLNFYRDNAVKPDGRVWARWAYTNEDIMPGKVTDKGFYETQWGYLLDANPDLVSNVAELYDQTGDLAWVKTHQLSCEKVLNWILKRDADKNGLVEMMTDSHKQKRGSDWIDIIWASYENAFVNAKLYHALVLWAAIEKQLGNNERSNYYGQFAAKLKTSFNKPVTEGGFWDNDEQCYIHWRDKDGSVHGNNMVTPVNFMAIGYGICDDSLRIKIILDNIENQMQKEQLFFWPVCMHTYKEGEGNDRQFPFPDYENGDIFLSWGALGVKVYAAYKPELALKYVNNVLAQYAKDGLAFQRYGRIKQDGLGDDILSGNSLTVVGLYQDIYGINPLYNRFYLNPHITEALAGTQIKYHYRNQQLLVELAMNNYAVSNKRFKIIAGNDFGFYSSANELLYFNGNDAIPSIKVKTALNSTLTLFIKSYSSNKISCKQSSADAHLNKLIYSFNALKPASYYTVCVNNQILKRMKTNASGSLLFNYKTSKEPVVIEIENK
jgi:hypothetical protein